MHHLLVGEQSCFFTPSHHAPLWFLFRFGIFLHPYVKLSSSILLAIFFFLELWECQIHQFIFLDIICTYQFICFLLIANNSFFVFLILLGKVNSIYIMICSLYSPDLWVGQHPGCIPAFSWFLIKSSIFHYHI